MIKLVLPLALASALGGCAVYGPPPAPATYYQTSAVYPGYSQPDYPQPVYTQPVYAAPYIPFPWFSFNFGYWGGHGWHGPR